VSFPTVFLDKLTYIFMKKLFLLAVLIVVSMIGANAQKMNEVSLNLFSPFVRTLSLSYERGLNSNMSLQFTGNYLFGYTIEDDGAGSTTKFSGYGFVPEFRYFPSGNALKGFFVSPFLRYRHTSFTSETPSLNLEEKATLNQIGGGLTVGAQWIFGDVISMELHGGPGVQSNAYNYESNQNDVDTGRLPAGFIFFRSGFRIGVAF
jgi:hypothetical protein